MRSQKMMVEYAICVAKLDNKSLADLRVTVDQFDTVHHGLIHGSEELFLAPATDPQVTQHGGMLAASVQTMGRQMAPPRDCAADGDGRLTQVDV